MNTVQESQQTQKSPKCGKAFRECREWFKAFVIAICIFAVCRLLVFDVNEVSGSSMAPSFNRGDKVIVEKLTYRFFDPMRGDIIVFRKPGTSKRLIKRVIAQPGDVLSMKEGDLYINGGRIEEPYVLSENNSYVSRIEIIDGSIYVDRQKIESPVYAEGTVYASSGKSSGAVPEGMYVVLGDNRDISLDSRTWGFLPEELIIGKVFCSFRLWPLFVDMQ